MGITNLIFNGLWGDGATLSPRHNPLLAYERHLWLILDPFCHQYRPIWYKERLQWQFSCHYRHFINTQHIDKCTI